MYHEEKIPKNNKKGNIKIRKFSIKDIQTYKIKTCEYIYNDIQNELNDKIIYI